jgi:hypothetical protein
MSDGFSEGETLANLALKWDNATALTFVLEAAEVLGDEGKGEGGKVGKDGWEEEVGRGEMSTKEDAGVSAVSCSQLCIEGDSACAPGSAVGFEGRAYGHVDLGGQTHNEHAGVGVNEMPYIAADNASALRHQVSRVGIQVRLSTPSRTRNPEYETRIPTHGSNFYCLLRVSLRPSCLSTGIVAASVSRSVLERLQPHRLVP